MAKTVDPTSATRDAVPTPNAGGPRPESARPRPAIQPDRDRAGAPPAEGTPSNTRASQVISRMPGGGAPSRARMMNGFQAAAGNARVGRLAVQAKLAISHPDDQYEREADQVATKVARMPASSGDAPVTEPDEPREKVTPFPSRASTAVARLAHPDSAEAGDPRDRHIPVEQPAVRPAEMPVQRRVDDAARERGRSQSPRADSPTTSEQGTTETRTRARELSEPKPSASISRIPDGVSLVAASDAPASVEGALESRIQSPSGGRPLSEGMRRDMEHGIGADFSNVRVHDTAADRADADHLNAKAFTHGSDIWIGSSGSASDRQLMAHELTHVVQQGGDVRRQAATDGGGDSGVAVAEPETSRDEESSREIQPPADVASAAVAPDNVPGAGEKQEEPALDAAEGHNATASAEPQEPPPQAMEGPTPAAAPPTAPGGEPPSSPAPNLQSPAADAAAASEDDVAAMTQLPARAPEGRPDGGAPEPSADLTAPPENMAAASIAAPDAAAAAPPSAPAASAPAASAPLVQRDDNDDGGVLASVRRRITSVVEGLRSGWTAMGDLARAGFDVLKTQLAGVVGVLTSVVSSALTVIQNTWTTITKQVTEVVKTVQRQVENVIGAVLGAAQAFAGAILRLDPVGLRGAWSKILGLINGLTQKINQAAASVLQTIAGWWQGLRGKFDALLSSIGARARELFTGMQTGVQSLRNSLSTAWTNLKTRASQMSGVLGGILDRLRRLLSELVSWGQRVWDGIQEQWRALSARLAPLLQSLVDRLTAVAQQLRGRATSWWTQIQNFWTRLKNWVSQQIQRVVNAVRAIWTRLQGLSITTLILKITGLSTVMRLIQELVQDFRSYLTPAAIAISSKVYAGMPGSANGFASQQVAKLAGGPPALDAGEASDSDQSAATTVVQRVPRSVATWSDIGTGFLKAIKDMWDALTFGAFVDMVLNVIVEQLLPFIAVYRQGKAFIFEDMKAMIDGLYWPRNILSDPLGALHDIYTNLLHLIADTILALLRRIINILMAFMLWITVALTIIGAVGGATAVGIFGAILGALAGLGIGAAPGGAAGAAAGGAAGAGVGFGVAALLNEAIFFAFLIVHATTCVELLVDLKTTLQTDDEKKRDYKQLAESAIAVGVGLIILGLANLFAGLAGWIAKGCAELVKRLESSFPTLSRFLRGIGLVKPPKPGAPSTGAAAAALAAEQRLAAQVGGALARSLVADLGAEAAEALVARLGAASVRRLGAELTARQIALVAERLSAEAVDRLLTGGIRPSPIHAAVVAGQAARLEALTVDQIARLSTLTDAGFGRIIGLPQAQFDRFIALAAPQLKAFAEMDAAAFGRFAALTDAEFARFRAMPVDRIAAFARLSNAAFERFRLLADADFAKFNALPVDAISRFGGLSDAAFARFAALDQAALQKFANIATPALERYGVMNAARFNVIAQCQQATIEKLATLTDPAFNRFAGINYTIAELDRLGRIDAAALENLATVTDQGHLIFLTRALDEATLGRLGQLSGPEIDTLLGRVGTNPPRLRTLATLSAAEMRKFLAIASDQLLRDFADLTPAELASFRSLTTAELDRFARVDPGNLGKFGRLGEAGVRRFATLTPAQIQKFGLLTDAQLTTWAGTSPGTFTSFVNRDAVTLGKLADGAGIAGLERLAATPAFADELSLLSTPAMRRYMALPPGDLAKFNGMKAFNMEQLAARPPGELENLAATRTPADLLAEAGDTAANRAANRAQVLGLDNPAINPATGRPRGHASEHAAGTDVAPPGGGMSPVEVRLRTGVTPSGAAGPIPAEVSVFASDAAQLEAVRIGETRLNAEIAAGNPLGAPPLFRKDFQRVAFDGAGYSYRIEGGTVDPATGHIGGGQMVRRQVGSFTISFEPTTPPPGPVPTSPADYFIVTMFPE